MKIENHRKQKFKDIVNHIAISRGYDNNKYPKIKYNIDIKGNIKPIRINGNDCDDCVAYFMLVKPFKKPSNLTNDEMIKYVDFIKRRHHSRREKAIEQLIELKNGRLDDDFNDITSKERWIKEIENDLTNELSSDGVLRIIEEDIEKLKWVRGEERIPIAITNSDVIKLERKLKLSRIDGENIIVKTTRKKVEPKMKLNVGEIYGLGSRLIKIVRKTKRQYQYVNINYSLPIEIQKKRKEYWRLQCGFYKHVKIEELYIYDENKDIKTLRLRDDGNWWDGSGYGSKSVNDKKEIIIDDPSPM
jgi:hypothetical protein